MQRVAVSKPFDRRQLGAVVHHRERQARHDAPAVQEDRASAALAVIASFLSSGEVEMLAQEVQDAGPRLHLQRPFGTVDRQADRDFHAVSVAKDIPALASAIEWAAMTSADS